MTGVPPELLRPHPDRLDPATPGYDEVLAAHERAVREGDPGYLDPLTGRFAMTAAFLWDRGYCCGSGCRHCPYVDRAERAVPGG